jgi:hemolysin activation/secretion protein
MKACIPKSKYLPFLLLALSHNVLAALPPNAGSQIQQIPPAPSLQKILPEVNVEHDSALTAPNPDQLNIVVTALTITGAHAFSEIDLLTLTGFKSESKLTIAELRAMASKITEFYHRHGYFVAQTYLPAQDIKDGIVTLSVFEGHYGSVSLHNQSKVPDSLADKILSGLNKTDSITYAPLETRLLLLSDLPGVKVKSTLMPGAAVGTSDLIVDMTPQQRVTGSVDVDNAGGRYTGTSRIGASANFNNPAGLGDVATIRALTSGTGLNYVRAAYQMQWGRAKAGISYSSLLYALGQEFESLQANGSANVASLFASYPLIRSRSNNLYAQLNYDSKTNQDKIDSIFSVTNKQAHVLVASINGDFHDNIGRGGLSNYSLSLASGNIDLQTPAMQSLDAATVQSNGNYNKLSFNAMRLQRVTDSTSLYASVNGQVAPKNMDISEKMELGGMYAVRAYPEGEAYADQGYVLNLESRTQLPKLFERLSGEMQFIGFLDTGTVMTNKNPWLVTQNFRTLSGGGVGLNWTGTNNFVLKTYYAHKIGTEAATSAPDASDRFWMQAVKYF